LDGESSCTDDEGVGTDHEGYCTEEEAPFIDGTASCTADEIGFIEPTARCTDARTLSLSPRPPHCMNGLIPPTKAAPPARCDPALASKSFTSAYDGGQRLELKPPFPQRNVAPGESE
jgi:hypothetical protein